MKNQTFKQNRKYFLISAMFLIGIFVYMGGFGLDFYISASN